MAHTFSISIKGSAQKMVDKVKALAEKEGGSFYGTAESGSFSGGKVKGTYRVYSDSVQITLTEKPMVVPWWKIEKEIRKFFS